MAREAVDFETLLHNNPISRWLVKTEAILKTHQRLRNVVIGIKERYYGLDVALALGLLAYAFLMTWFPPSAYSAENYHYLYPGLAPAHALGLFACGIGGLLMIPRNQHLRWVNGWWPFWHDSAAIIGWTLVAGIGVAGWISAVVIGLTPIGPVILFFLGIAGVFFSSIRFVLQAER